MALPAKKENVDDWVTPPEGYDGPDDWVSPAPAPSKSSAVGAFARGAERGALPAAGGVAGFAAGASAVQPVVAPLAAAAGPAAPVVEGVGTFLGGAAGAYGGATAVQHAQQWVLDHAPEGVVKALGLDKEQELADVEEHPIASFAGELAPNLAAFRPGAVAQSLEEGAPKIAKLMAHPVTARAVPATIMGAQEAASEQLNEGQIDPTKVALSAGLGALSNRETALGQKLTRAGAAPVEAVTRAVRSRVSPMASPEEAAAPVLEAGSVDEAIAAASDVVNRPPMDIEAMGETARKQGEVAAAAEPVPEALSEAAAPPVEASQGLPTPTDGSPAAEIAPEPLPSVRETPAYAEAKERADTYARWLDELDAKRRQDAAASPKAAFLQHTIDAIVGKVNGREEALTGKQAQRLAQARSDLETLLNPEGDSPDMARVRAAMVAEHQKLADAVVAHRDEALSRAQEAQKAARALDEDLPFETAGQIANHMDQHGIDADTAVRDHIENQALQEVRSDHEQTGAYPEAQSLGGRQGDPDSSPGKGIRGRETFTGDEGAAPEAGQPAPQNPEPVRQLSPKAWEPLYDEEGAHIGWYDKVADEVHFGVDHPDEAVQALPRAEQPGAEAPMLSRPEGGEGTGKRPVDFTGVFTPEFEAARKTIGTELRQRLDDLGLKDVALDLPDSIVATTEDGSKVATNGLHANKLIAVAMEASPDGVPHTGVLDHEAVHAARALGLFNKSEWSILANRASRDWRGRYKVDERYGDLSEEKRNEEAIAEAFRHWAADRTTQKGTFARLFDKLRNALAAIGNVLRGHGFQTHDSIFRKFAEGEIGARPRTERPDGQVQFQLREKGEQPGSVPMRAVFIRSTGKVEFRPVEQATPKAQAQPKKTEASKPAPAATPKPEAKSDAPAKSEAPKPVPQAVAAKEPQPAQRPEPKSEDRSPAPETQPRAQALKAIEGTGEERARAINGELYNVGEEKPQLEAAAELVEKDFDRAVAIAMRQRQAPKGIHPEFVYMAVEAKAVRDGDIDLQRKLSTSKIAEEATTMGQRIAAWRNRAEISPVDDMRKIQEARAAKLKERGVEPEKAVEAIVEQGQQQIQKAAKSTKRPAWNDFIMSIVCPS